MADDLPVAIGEIARDIRRQIASHPRAPTFTISRGDMSAIADCLEALATAIRMAPVAAPKKPQRFAERLASLRLGGPA